jgi:hypothetical protein
MLLVLLPVTTTWRVLNLRLEEWPTDMEGTFENIKEITAYSRKGVVLQIGRLSEKLTTPHRRNLLCYELLHKA